MTLTTINLAALGDTINLGTEVTGTLPTGNGGTGSTATTFVNAASNVTGTLPVPNGGTGLASGTTDQLLKFTGTTTLASSAISTGKILQAQSAVFNNNNMNNTSTYAATSITLNITPSAANSKVLVLMSVSSIYVSDSDTNIDLAISRTGGASGDGNILEFEGTAGYDTDIAGHGAGGTAITYLDSPATTSAVTYGCKFRSSNNTHNAYINHYIRGDVRPRSSITLLEVAN